MAFNWLHVLIEWDGWRWVNAALALLAVMALSFGTRVRWKYMTRRLRRIVLWVILTYAIIAYGSTEVALSNPDVSAGLRVFLTTLNLVGLNIALLYGITDDVENPLETSALTHTGTLHVRWPFRR